MFMDNRTLDVVLDTACVVLMTLALIDGIGFIWLGSEQHYSSATYERMTDLMPMQLWGIIFIVVFILYLLGVIIEFKRAQFLLFMAGGIIGGLTQLLYTIASFDASDYQVHTIRYLFFAILHLVVASMGVYAWLKTRKGT
jgi:hypothetical protein